MPTKCVIDGLMKNNFIGYSTFADHKFKVVQCPKCQLMYVDVTDRNLWNILKNYYGKGKFETQKYKRIPLQNIREKISRMSGLFYSEDDSRLNFLKKNGLTTDMLVMDVGSGPGTFAIWLDKNGYSVNCIELDPKKVKLTNKHLKKGKAFVGFVEDSFNKKFDIICLVHVLEHLLRPDIFLKELKIKKPKSTLFMEIPDCSSKIGLKLSLKYPHNYHFNVESIKKLLVKTGWKIISIEKFDSNQMHPRKWFEDLGWLFFNQDVSKPRGKGPVLRIIAK